MQLPTIYTPTVDYPLLGAFTVLLVGAVLTVETPSLRRWVLPAGGTAILAAASLLLNLRWLFPSIIPACLTPYPSALLEFAKVYHILYAAQTLVASDATLEPTALLVSNHIVHIFAYDFLLTRGYTHVTSLLLFQSTNGFLQALGHLRGTGRAMILLQSYIRLATSLWLLYQYWTLNIPAPVFGIVAVSTITHQYFKLTYPYSQLISEPLL